MGRPPISRQCRGNACSRSESRGDPTPPIRALRPWARPQGVPVAPVISDWRTPDRAGPGHGLSPWCWPWVRPAD